MSQPTPTAPLPAALEVLEALARTALASGDMPAHLTYGKAYHAVADAIYTATGVEAREDDALELRAELEAAYRAHPVVKREYVVAAGALEASLAAKPLTTDEQWAANAFREMGL